MDVVMHGERERVFVISVVETRQTGGDKTTVGRSGTVHRATHNTSSSNITRPCRLFLSLSLSPPLASLSPSPLRFPKMVSGLRLRMLTPVQLRNRRRACDRDYAPGRED